MYENKNTIVQAGYLLRNSENAVLTAEGSMRTVGIIAEYNPFHTGHAYHIGKAKEMSGADYAVVVMSPDFVQRGEPALFDKYTRARMALQNGADLVLELPVCYATASAEYFALGAVTLLDRLGVVDSLCFGAENANPMLFDTAAAIFSTEPPEYTERLRNLLRQGKTFPQARSEAFLCCLRHDSVTGDGFDSPASSEGDHPEMQFFSDFLINPNNILGVEYCKALRSLQSRIRPLPVCRESVSYHSTALDGDFCSAAAIRRELLRSDATDNVMRYIPHNCHNLFHTAEKSFVTSEELLPYLTQKLLACDSFDSIFDISPALSDRIRNLRFNCVGKTYGQIVAILKSRQTTEAHIRRALLHLILEIRSEDIDRFRADGTAAYIKVLGLRRDASALHRQIKHACSLPFITKPASGIQLCSASAKRMWQQDLFASHIYRSIQANRSHLTFRTEYEISPLIL